MVGFSIHRKGRLDASRALAWHRLVDEPSTDEWLELSASEDLRFGFLLLSEGWIRHAGRRRVAVEVTELDPPHRLVLRVVDPTPLLRVVEVSIELASVDRGTEFRIDVAATVPPLAILLIPWLRLRVEIALHRGVRGFRSFIERCVATERRSKARTGAATPAGWVNLPRVDFTADQIVGG